MSTEAFSTYPVIPIPKDSTATILELELVFDDAPEDLTGATGILFNVKDRSGTAVATDVACTITNAPGTDGKIDAPLNAAIVGTVRDLIGDIRYTPSGGGTYVSWPFILQIASGAK